MVRRITAIVILLLVFCVAGLAQTEAQMEEDAERVNDIYKKAKAIKDFRMPEGVSQRIGENYTAYQTALDGMNKMRLLKTDNSDFLTSFAGKYAGNEKELYKISVALNKRFAPLSLSFDVGDDYEYVMDRFSQLLTAGEKNAMTALKHIEDNGLDASTLKALHEIYRVKSIEESKDLLSIAVLFDPGNERVERRVERLRGLLETNLSEYKAEEMRVLQSREWKPNIGSTSAGSPVSLAAAAHSYMTGLPDWGGNTKKQTKIKKVSIIGDWFVAERDALGRPTRYGLPAAVALSDNTMAPDVVTVYEISLITADPEKNTRWYGVWVGKVWRMLDANLPK